MDELLTRLEELGLDPNKAEEVAMSVRRFLEEKLPDPIAAKLDDILTGSPETMETLLDKLPADAISGAVGDKLKGFLGR